MLVKFLMELEHSAPVNDKILNEGVNWWQCGQPGSIPTRTVLPIVVYYNGFTTIYCKIYA